MMLFFLDLKIEDDTPEDVKLFNPLNRLKDSEYGYTYVQKARNFMRIHQSLLDPDNELIQTLVRLFKDGKPSRKAMKRHLNYRKIHEKQRE